MPVFIWDGCSVPAFLKTNKLTGAYFTKWCEIFKPACYAHDLDHAHRKKWRFIANWHFFCRCIVRAVKRTDDFKEIRGGIRAAFLFWFGVMVGGWIDWFILAPKQKFDYWKLTRKKKGVNPYAK